MLHKTLAAFSDVFRGVSYVGVPYVGVPYVLCVCVCVCVVCSRSSTRCAVCMSGKQQRLVAAEADLQLQPALHLARLVPELQLRNGLYWHLRLRDIVGCTFLTFSKTLRSIVPPRAPDFELG